MERKKVIITAVMINAALLTVLFIAAVTSKEEPISPLPEGARFSAAFEAQEQSSEIPLFTQAPPASNPFPIVFTLPPEEEQKGSETAAAVVQQTTVQQMPLSTPPEILAEMEIEVQKGDTLEKLAKVYHTRVDEIIKLNQLPSSFLKVGQRLKIPSEKTIEMIKPKQAAPLLGESPEYYVMKVGDNPWSIAMKHHIKVDELLKLNGLNEKTARKLKPGDRLRIR